jgi:hypothetical protein
MTSHKGIVAGMIATTPLGKYCSAQITAPVPNESRRIPAMDILIMSFSGGRSWFLIQHQVSSKIPAIKKRIPQRKKGGKLSSANNIAKYVEPQPKYNVAKAIITNTF